MKNEKYIMKRTRGDTTYLLAKIEREQPIWVVDVVSPKRYYSIHFEKRVEAEEFIKERT